MFKKLLILISLFICPLAANASEFYFDSVPKQVSQDDTFVVMLKLSTSGKSINAIDGSILYDDEKIEVKELSTGGSILNLWATPPVVAEEGRVIFVGGITGGYQGKQAEIIKLILSAKKAGNAQISLGANSLLLLNDGKGTPDTYTATNLYVEISERTLNTTPVNEWQNLLDSDKNPPAPFEITVGQASSMFGGKYFISFFTTDAESGVAYYEVQEGERDFIRTESPYLLQDQSLKSLIKVRAFDKAGNVQTAALAAPRAKAVYQKSWFWGILIIVSALIYLGGKLWRKKRYSSNR